MKISREKALEHIVASVAISAENTAAFAFYEVGIAGMSSEVSFHARLLSATTVLLGIGAVYSGIRDFLQTRFHLDTASDLKQTAFDITYNAFFCGFYSIPLYLASGTRDPKEIALGTLGGFVIGSINGAPQGYAIVVAKDLMGVKECSRPSYPSGLQRAIPVQKKMLAAGLLLGSLLVTEGIYTIHDHFPLEQTVQAH